MASSQHPPKTTSSSSSSSSSSYDGNDRNLPLRPALSLSDAMKAADCIRKVSNDDDDPTERRSVPPGTAEGLGTFILTGLLLSPLRTAVLNVAGRQAAGQSFRNFCDLVVTPFMAVLGAQAGLVAGTLYGSRVYLQQVANVPPWKESPITDRTCNQLLLLSLGATDETTTTQNSQPMVEENQYDWADDGGVGGGAGKEQPTSSWWDPRVETMQSLRLAIENCQKRSSLDPKVG